MSANTLTRWPKNPKCLIGFKQIKKALEDGYAVYAIHTSLGGVGVRICDVKDRDNKPIKLCTGRWLDPHCIVIDKDQQLVEVAQQQTLF